ncbi:MAG: hypothetical protein JW908_07245 [Anaerolineales bacterium]|nr:hypothetical protein [Anaerolineales bacterium]
MIRKILCVGLVFLLGVLLLTTTVAAQTSTGFDLSWSALAGGGRETASASIALHSTLGQWVAGPTDSDSYAVNNGYWQRWQDQTICLPIILR